MINWAVTKLIVKPNADGLKDVVAYVQWKAHHGATSKFGTVGLTVPSAGFIPYADLTEQHALHWVWQSVNKDEIEAELTEPSIPLRQDLALLPLPWA